MSESGPLPPGWEKTREGVWRRNLGPYVLEVYRMDRYGLPHLYRPGADLETPLGVLGLYADGMPTLPYACRRAEELAEELSRWRPPKLKKNANDRK